MSNRPTYTMDEWNTMLGHKKPRVLKRGSETISTTTKTVYDGKIGYDGEQVHVTVYDETVVTRHTIIKAIENPPNEG